MDGNPALVNFAHKLEQAAVETIESGIMTKDLAGLWEGESAATAVNTGVFLQSIKLRLEKLLEQA